MHGLELALDAVRLEFEASRIESAWKARAALISELQELLRRFRSYEGEGEWISVLLDGASRFVHQFALFTLRDSTLELRGERGLNLPDRSTIDVPAARAIAAAISSKDVVVALRTAGEVGAALSVPEPARAFIAPILNGQRVVALLLAVLDAETDTEGLEFVAGMSSIVLERQSNAGVAVRIAPLATPIKEAAAASPFFASSSVDWANLTEDERSLQIKARRFARIKVAEAQLAHPDAARAGREQNNVYLFLKGDIDLARESYRTQFMRDRSMIDYFHLELVRIAADGEESKLGAEYPGPLA
jgi:hypothetical protein